MTDFVDGLEDDLVGAAARQAQARRTARIVRRLRSSPRGLAIAIAVLAGAGSATAAVVALDTEPTMPLAGPRDTAPSARGYALSLLPTMLAGHAGWCTVLRLETGSRLTSVGTGCGLPRALGGNVIAGGATYTQRDGIAYAIVTERVRAVRFGDRVVATRADRALPHRWRFAIALLDGATMPRVPAAPGPAAPPFVSPIPLDADGAALPSTTAADRRARGGGSREVTTGRPARRCVIGTAAGFTVRYARVALGRPKLPGPIEGRAFAACASTVFRAPGRRARLQAVIWRDARDPGRLADALPKTPGLSGRRLGRGWIAVYGASAAQRATLLARLRPRL